MRRANCGEGLKIRHLAQNLLPKAFSSAPNIGQNHHVSAQSAAIMYLS
jgi:hypothetical protein